MHFQLKNALRRAASVLQKAPAARPFASSARNALGVLLTLALCLLSPLCLHAHDTAPLADHTRIQPLSDFRVMGEFELRTQKDRAAPVACRTLNHENGMKLRVLEVLGADDYGGERGLWLYVLLTAPMWVDSGEWIEAYRKFLIFRPASAAVYDFEE